ncbi:MAG: AAA family ATPase [Candidatus Omnitrophota bacterium]|jgi:chromosome segregation protein
MYFKKLELVGFKSFMEKTTLNFEPGVTAIVGPNGCGKSNIFDSIRWVLGEQSVKSLRGSQMEDVIFNGTDSKPPLGMAEVSLTFDNENKFFPVEHREVVITRRIFRSGESEYLLNKSTARLKDILDLLMGTGIGAESYSLIAQGKIDLVLSSRPEDRRMVFDEAAGITRYKVQKKEALRRLEETEQNLLRVNDIISEVKRSIGYLERQANKARKYKEAFEILKAKEIKRALCQKKKLNKERDELLSQLTAFKNEEEALHHAIQESEGAIEARNQEARDLENKIAAIRNQVLSLENSLSHDEQHITFNQERLKEMEKAKAYLETQVEQTRARLLLDEEKLSKLKEEELTIRTHYEEKTILLREKEAQFNDLLVSTQAALETIAQAKAAIMDLAAKASLAKNDIIDVTSKKQVVLARSKRLDIEKAKVSEERAVIEGNLNSLDIELKQVQEVLQVLTLQEAQLSQALVQEKASLAQLHTDLENLERQKSALESHREFLEKLKTQYESIDTSLNAEIYLDQMPLEKITGLVIKVKDYCNGAQDGQQQDARFKLAGEAKPIDLDAVRVSEKIAQLEERLVELRNDKSAKEKHTQELAASIKEFEEKAQEQELALGNKNTFHQAALEQFNKVKEEEEIIALELSDVRNELLSLDEKSASCETHFAELDKLQKDQESLIHSHQEKVNANVAIKEEIVVVITKTKTELEALSRRLGTEDNTLKLLEDAYNHNKENILNLEKQIQDNLSRKSSLELESASLTEKIAQEQSDCVARRSSLDEEETRYGEISGSVRQLSEAIENQRKRIDVLKDTLYSLQMEEKDFDFKYMSIKERLLQVYKIDLDTAQVVPQEGVLQEQVSAENQQPVTEAKNLEPAMVDEQIDEIVLGQEIDSLKSKIDSYGTVNLVAIEEYDELKKRYDFLTQQQNDLATAKSSIQDAIHKINRTTRKMFLETFEKVAEEFRNYFRLLFNGGDAKVYLIDEQDPLESGIEIICRPPGKKLQNVLLLSGGEKSLSAIALIFAIFKVKPAPFCILDEIDAALDEANVDRFSRLFQDFTNTSQFIVITHNKRTIANAHVMYGITMVESGISKIVSVKFAADKPAAVKEENKEAVAA